ncbi:MAG: box helicase domain protein, partial [Akkermansiaceae bacterium]|nr:box helicase domain protein [Akkermansiaceae bacterium]
MTASDELLHPAIRRALWDMRWTSLRPLQDQTIQTFFTTPNPLILSASTASGKTEAAFLPVLSAIADEAEGSVRAIYVGPLKALINDQFSRVETLCQHSNIPVHRWHGDVSATDKERLRSDPGGVLLITPESLESAFINYGNRLTRIFASLDYIVIDELHSFIGDVRGVHLRSLIHRLAQVIGKMPRILGLSATLADFDSARRFLDSIDPARVTVIEDHTEKRSIKIGLRAYPQPKPRPVEGEGETEPEAKTRTAANAVEASEDLATLA